MAKTTAAASSRSSAGDAASSTAPTPSAANAALIQLSELLRARAEIFAGARSLPTSSMQQEGGDASAQGIYDGTLRTTKQLFDESLRGEASTLSALAKLLGEIRGDGGASARDIQTRSKAAGASKGKGKGKAGSCYSSLPLFRPTPLQELYLGEGSTAGTSASAAHEAELAQKMVWEQLEMRTGKVLEVFREIVKDGATSSDEENEGAELDSDEEELDEGDSDEELVDGEEGSEEDGLSDDDEDLDEEDLEDEAADGFDYDDEDEDEEEDQENMPDAEKPQQGAAKKALAKPYFTQLRDNSTHPEEDEDDEAASSSASASGKKQKRPSAVATAKGDTPLDAGFFSLKDFNSQSFAGEDEMTRYMASGKSKSANDRPDRSGAARKEGLDGLMDEDDEDDENDEIDYFAPVGDSEDDEEDDEDGDDSDGEVKPENMRYADFWNPPSKLFVDVPGSKAGKREREREEEAAAEAKNAKGKQQANGAVASGKGKGRAADASGAAISPKKRRVSFHDAVKVQEYEVDDPDAQKSAIAAMVKQVGMKETMRRLASGEMDDEAAFDEDEDEEEEGPDDLMLSDMLDGDAEEDEDEEEEEEEEMSEDGEELSEEDGDGDADAQVMRRLNKDLFAEDEDDDPTSSALTKDQKAASRSRYEARMAALSDQIAELEAENVAARDWTMRGEAKSRDRPVNSLLEEDLEFDQVAKVVPVVTEESSLTLEDKIKKRIIEENFDDVVRKRIQEPTAYLPSRLLDVKNTASERSLAEIYADEFAVERARAAGADIPVPEIDAKLQKEHDLISSVFDEVCDKLDALSNARFTPRAAQTQITSISNAPSVSLESALPTGASTSTLLAPEEIFAPQQRGTLTSKAEMTPSQKKAERLRARKAKQVTMQAIQKYGGNGGGKSASKQKDRAMNSLIGKRGVTVIGKGKTAKSALTGRDRKERVNDANGPSSANAFKL